MVFVSVTRLRLRSLRLLPAFALHTFRSARQIAAAEGFLGGGFATEGARVFWTVTAWDGDAVMRAYRNSGAHLRAMPRLLDWCDEASVVHWQQDDAGLPGGPELLKRMVADGSLSKVRRPTPEHAAGLICPNRRVPRDGPPLRPRR